MLLTILSFGSAVLLAQDEVATELSCVPETYVASLDCLEVTLSDESKSELVGLPYDDLIQTHMGLGMWIRNNWGLWSGGPLYDEMREFGFAHPDDMSTVIIEGFWARENGCSYDLEANATEYQRFWSEQMESAEAVRDEDGNIPVGSDLASPEFHFPEPICSNASAEGTER